MNIQEHKAEARKTTQARCLACQGEKLGVRRPYLHHTCDGDMKDWQKAMRAVVDEAANACPNCHEGPVRGGGVGAMCDAHWKLRAEIMAEEE